MLETDIRPIKPNRNTPNQWHRDGAYKEFFANESGAVTVDWVVLTAAVVGLAMITYVGLAENTQAVTNATGATVLTAQEFLTN